MKKATTFFLYFMIVRSAGSIAQAGIPSFPEVVKTFFKNYSYEPQERNDHLSFAKKANGWSVQVIDRLHDDSIKTEELFWEGGENKFHLLTKFEQGPDSAATRKISVMIQGEGDPLAYGYERCRYFGYDTWDVDMINDFGSNIPSNDTLLEGLARAYSSYANRYTGYIAGGKPYNNDPLKARLGKFEPRSPERIKQFINYTEKGIECYRILQERNPAYLMVVGTPEIKVRNEQFEEYEQLMTYGYEKEARALLATVQKSEMYSQMGRTFLSACPLNSILITYGDNDTYPLWYVQAKEGFRKDVTVLNNSLLGTVQYVNAAKKNNPSVFSTTSSFLKRLQVEALYFMEESGQVADISIPLPTFIEEVQTIKYPYVSTDTLVTYRAKTVLFDVNVARLKKICNQANLASVMTFQLKDNMLLSDFILLDILSSSLHTRPICVTAQGGIFPEEYLQHEGSIYRVLPLNADPPEAKIRIEIAKIEGYLLKNYKPVVMKYGKDLLQSDDALHGIQQNLIVDLINGYTVLNNKAKAKEWAAKYVAHPDFKKFPVSLSDHRIAEALLNTGYDNEAKAIVEKIADKLIASYRHFSALDYYYYSKEDTINFLEYLRSMLQTKTVKSDKLDNLITGLQKDEE